MEDLLTYDEIYDIAEFAVGDGVISYDITDLLETANKGVEELEYELKSIAPGNDWDDGLRAIFATLIVMLETNGHERDDLYKIIKCWKGRLD